MTWGARIACGVFLILGAWGRVSWAVGPTYVGDSFGVSPFLDWKQVETEHFIVTYPRELEGVGQKIAQHYEEALALLSGPLGWVPQGKVPVLALDNSDAANGMTTPQGRFGMILYVTPPETWYSTTYYDDWLRLLVIHEFTHYLNMDPTNSFWSILRYAFGPILLPNAIWPPWMLEGLAVYMETRLTRGGRGRSPYYEMVLRSAVDEGVLDTDAFVTLDRVNGDNPYYPGGETIYLFGYHLMNAVARDSAVLERKKTADGEDVLSSGDDALGQLSIRSSRRIPFFINGNLENVAGKDWHTYWAEWVSETRSRMGKQIAEIKKNPTTGVTWLTDRGFEVLGNAVSPDGRWLAYSMDSLDRRPGLYFRRLDRAEPEKRLADKLGGANLSFTPDGKYLLLSWLERRMQYSLNSDLAVYDIDRDKIIPLTEGLRARDPQVSPDGGAVAFTLTESTTTGLALAPLQIGADGPTLGPVKKLYTPAAMDRIASPRFSLDGKKIVASIHRNGKFAEDLIEVDVATGEAKEILADGFFNRFPTFSPKGDLLFVSNATGVDNLYRWDPKARKGVALTNLVSGLAFPSVAPDGSVRAAVYRSKGWDLAQVAVDPTELKTVDGPPLVVNAGRWSSAPYTGQLETTPYSAWRSLLPRQWAPALWLSNRGAYIGAQASGFDSVMRHEYALGAAFDTGTAQPDAFAYYSNRQLGASLTAYASSMVVASDVSSAGVLSFTRQFYGSLGVSFPKRMTWSTLNMGISAGAERQFVWALALDPSKPTLTSATVPIVDADVTFSRTESSRLAIATERGFSSQLTLRGYGVDSPPLKIFASHAHFFSPGRHHVIAAKIAAQWVTHVPASYAGAAVLTSGRTPAISDTTGGQSVAALSMRGYPGVVAYSGSSAVTSIDYRLPLFRIFRGWGTLPAFANYVSGFVFAETTMIPNLGIANGWLPSLGGGVRLVLDAFFHFPVVLAVQYHRGFRAEFGGRGDLYFSANVTGFNF